MKYLIPILGGLLLFSGCQETSNKSESAIDSTAVTAQQDSSCNLKPGFDYVQQIPDSFRTPEQKELAKQLLEISIEHVKVVDNRMVFDMSRDEFLKIGVPVEYYTLFKKNMEDNNEWIEKNNIQNADKMLQRYRQNTRRVLESKYEE